MGGFARRMSYWNAFAKKYPSRALLRLDAGSMFSRGTAVSTIINRFMVEGTYKSKLDAIGLSAWDLSAWQEIGDMAAAGMMPREFLNLPLVAGNLTAKVPNFPAFQPYIVKEMRLDAKAGKPLRVGITGILVDPENRMSRADFQIQSPAEAASRIVEQLHDKADYVIVLTDMGLGEAITLAVGVPGIHMIVVSHNYGAPTDAQQVGDTLIIGPVNEGRMLSEVRLNLKSGAQSVQIESHVIGLDKTVPDDPAMAELERKAKAEIEKVQK